MSTRVACLLSIASLVAVACQSAPAEVRDGWAFYGAGLSEGAPVALTEVLAAASVHQGRTVFVEGTIDEVCLVKGCWLTFRDGDHTVRVTFKDYDFFVPKDIAGRTARVEGVFSLREVPVDEARHYLEDAGKHDEAAALTEPEVGYQLVATGVAIQEP